jgi:hypothetical protein
MNRDDKVIELGYSLEHRLIKSGAVDVQRPVVAFPSGS